jgi:hypothetical protein
MKFTRKISAFLMTALMFVATTNIVLSAHICSGELYNFSIFEETTSCCGHSSGNDPDQNMTGSFAFSNAANCCSSITIETGGVDTIYPSIGLRDIDYQAVVLQLKVVDSVSISPADVQSSEFKPYLVHIANRDIPILIQSFLL